MAFSVAAPYYAIGAADERGKPIYVDARGVAFVFPEPITLPTAVTILGYALSLAWIAGAPWWIGVLGILADEVDGRLARARGETTAYGGELDYAADVTLTGLSAVKLLGPAGLAALPLVTMYQARMRSEGERPTVGSARAAMMAAKMVIR